MNYASLPCIADQSSGCAFNVTMPLQLTGMPEGYQRQTQTSYSTLLTRSMTTQGPSGHSFLRPSGYLTRRSKRIAGWWRLSGRPGSTRKVILEIGWNWSFCFDCMECLVAQDTVCHVALAELLTAKREDMLTSCARLLLQKANRSMNGGTKSLPRSARPPSSNARQEPEQNGSPSLCTST